MDNNFKHFVHLKQQKFTVQRVSNGKPFCTLNTEQWKPSSLSLFRDFLGRNWLKLGGPLIFAYKNNIFWVYFMQFNKYNHIILFISALTSASGTYSVSLKGLKAKVSAV